MHNLKLFFFLILFSCGLLNAQEKKIKLYAFYTPSHQEMLEKWFLPSLQDDYELVLEYYEQKCETGIYMDKGWIETMIYKVDLIIRGINETFGEYFIHSDVDIQFFGSTQQTIEEAIQNNDLVIQRDDPSGTLCAGFFACRSNERTLALWEAIKMELLNETNILNDQLLLNRILKEEQFDVKWKFLPDSFFGGGTFQGKFWEPGSDLMLPEAPLMHHANWTLGVKNKIAQLEYVNSIISCSKEKAM